MKLFIERDPHNQGEPLFVRDSVILHPGLLFVVGCNGSGKTAFLDTIEKSCKTSEGTIVKRFVPVTDAKESEGEQVAMSFSNFLEEVHTEVMKSERHQEIIVLADLSHAGITADNIVQIKSRLTTPILADANSREVDLFVLIGATDFEYFLDQECIDVQTFNLLRFNNYTSYKKYLMNSRKARDTRYKKIKFKED